METKEGGIRDAAFFVFCDFDEQGEYVAIEGDALHFLIFHFVAFVISCGYDDDFF